MVHAFKRILVPIEIDDEVELTTVAADLATVVAKQFGATLHFLHVSPPMASKEALAFDQGAVSALDTVMKANLARQAEGLRGWAKRATMAGANAESYVVTDARSIAETIVAEAKAKEIDLIVIGSHGRGGFKRVVLGSVADRVAHSAPCPVLIARQDIDDET